jgi:2-polyprenyl-6-methoxyphenol hydroxylase-like FAD-dependent oxidoreductase
MKSACIIGAGPAGSIAAIALARAGVCVTLVEQHRFPRDKVCGECLSAVGVEVLERLGLSSVVRRLHPAILQRSTVYCADGTRADLSLPRPMWGISRRKLDAALLDEARASGSHVVQPARCEGVDPGEPPSIRVRLLESNELRALNTDVVLIADGKRSLTTNPPPPTGDFGLKAHFTNIDCPPDTIELFGVRGHYGGIAPIEEGLFNLAFSVPAERLRAHTVTRASRPCEVRANGGPLRFESTTHGRDARVTDSALDEIFNRISQENSALSVRLRQAKRVSDWLVSPLPRFGVNRDWKQNIIPLGNAAAAIEPVGGEGMGLAMRSAEIAANEIVCAFAQNRDINVSRLQREFRSLWTMRSIACRAGGKILSSPTLSRLAVALAGSTDGPASLALRLVGK